MKYKHIEAAHEARMWIVQVIIPAAIGTAMLVSNPVVRQWVADKKHNIQEKVKSKFHK